VIDARRKEVFTLVDGEPAVVAPEELALEAGAIAIGDGARRYRELLSARGAEIPPDDDPAHIPWARHHAALAGDFGPAEAVEPLYLRVPDAEKTARR
jgi:tRNA A37 threonylcarbamoyladenosine modification protein TsaB